MPMSSPQMTRMFGWVAFEGVVVLADLADLGIDRLLLVSGGAHHSVVDLRAERGAYPSRTIGKIPAPAPLGLSPTVGRRSLAFRKVEPAHKVALPAVKTWVAAGRDAETWTTLESTIAWISRARAARG